MIPVVLDETAFQAGLKNINKGMTLLTKRIGEMSNKIGNFGLAASGALIGVGAATLTAARDAESANLKFRAVFREAAEESLRFAKDLGKTFHMTTSEVQGFMAQVQDLFVPMGMSRKEAAKLSEQVTDLATRVAVFNGQPTALTLQNITSGLVGVTRSVRQYGILLSEAGVKQEIMNQGWAKSEKEITEQQKVLARLNIMIASSADAMAKAPSLVAKSIKGQMDSVAKVFQDLREELGFALAPVLQDLVADIKPVLEGWVEWVKNNQELIVQVAELVPLLLKVSVALKGVSLASRGLTGLEALGVFGGAKGVPGKAMAGLGVGVGGFALGRVLRELFTGSKARQAREDATKKFAGELAERTVTRLRDGLTDRIRDETWLMPVEALGDRLLQALEEEGAEGLRSKEYAKAFMDSFRDELRQFEPGKLWRDEDSLRKFAESMKPVFEELPKEMVSALSRALEVKFAEMRKPAAELAKLRVEAFKGALDEMQRAIRKQHSWELAQLEKAMEQQKGVRLRAMKDMADAQRRIVERERGAEQAAFERKVGDPTLDAREQQRLILERLVELEREREAVQDGLVNDQRLLNEGTEMSADNLQRMKDDADEVTRLTEEQVQLNRDLLALEPAETYKELLPVMEEQEERLNDILNTADEVRQSIALEEAEQADARLKELHATATGMLEDMQARLDQFVEVAANVRLEIDADVAKQELTALQDMVDNLSRSLSGITLGGAPGGAQELEVTVTGGGGTASLPISDLADAIATAVARGDAG